MIADMRQAFLDAIQKNPYDEVSRKAFADWLEEHDEPELADLHRSCTRAKFDAAVATLESAASDCDLSYEVFLRRLTDMAGGGWDNFLFSDVDMPASVDSPRAVWEAYEVVRGVKVTIDKDSSIASCSC